MRNKYRIIYRSGWSGQMYYTAQVKFFLWPFCWFEIDNVNLSLTIDGAHKVINNHKRDSQGGVSATVAWSDEQ